MSRLCAAATAKVMGWDARASDDEVKEEINISHWHSVGVRVAAVIADESKFTEKINVANWHSVGARLTTLIADAAHAEDIRDESMEVCGVQFKEEIDVTHWHSVGARVAMVIADAANADDDHDDLMERLFAEAGTKVTG